MLARNMSTNIVNVLADKIMEVVSNQAAPVMSEVAVAAEDSWLPVAALQYAIDGIHTFTGLNWYDLRLLVRYGLEILILILCFRYILF